MNRTFEKERPVRHAIKIKTIGKNYSSGKLISRGTSYKNGGLFQNFFQMVFRQNEKQKLEIEEKNDFFKSTKVYSKNEEV